MDPVVKPQDDGQCLSDGGKYRGVLDCFVASRNDDSWAREYLPLAGDSEPDSMSLWILRSSLRSPQDDGTFGMTVVLGEIAVLQNLVIAMSEATRQPISRAHNQLAKNQHETKWILRSSLRSPQDDGTLCLTAYIPKTTVIASVSVAIQ